MDTIVLIDGREAIPVRAIPYVTGWMVSPDKIVAWLANTDLMKRFRSASAYHLLPGGSYAAMLPKEWDGVEADLQILEEKLKKAEQFDQEKYPEWRQQSIPFIPAGTFVWKDEFEPLFTKEYIPDHLKWTGERPGDRELNFTPRIPDEHRNIVLEGFSSLQKNSFSSLSDALEGHFDKALSELPLHLKQRVEREFLPTWEALSSWQRRSFAAQWDSQHDPAKAPENQYFFGLACDIDQVKRQIREWELIATPTASDKAIQEEKLKLLRAELEALQAKIRGPYPGDAAMAFVETMISTQRVVRKDAMWYEIESAIRELDNALSPAGVMQKLKSYAGKQGSCIYEIAADGVLWRNNSGENLKLDMSGLRKRLDRRNQKPDQAR